jgi:hypothetical protein
VRAARHAVPAPALPVEVLPALQAGSAPHAGRAGRLGGSGPRRRIPAEVEKRQGRGGRPRHLQEAAPAEPARGVGWRHLVLGHQTSFPAGTSLPLGRGGVPR